MEVNAKVKEMEEELKLLKAEIRNVLLDIREVILERSNPLGEEHESAFIRMDLNTTARAMAAEAAAHEAHEATRAAEHANAEEHMGATAQLPEEEDAPGAFGGPPPDDAMPGPEGGLAPAPGTGPEDAPPSAEAPAQDELAPKVIRRDLRQEPTFEPEAVTMEQTEIPPMYMAASLPSLGGTGSLSAWVTEAMETIGPENLERVIAMERLWGALPPNISRALAYLHELLQASREANPQWLKVMQDLDRLASF